MRKSNLERLRDSKRRKGASLELTEEGLIKLLVAPGKKADKRELNPTQRDFIYEQARIAAYMGAAGVAKTSTICAHGMLRVLTMPDTRLLVARFDYNKLLGTTALRLQEMIDALPKGTLLDRDKSPPMTWYVRPVEALATDEDVAPSQITFMGLKEELGSYEFTDAVIDEADEVDEHHARLVNTRLRHVRKGFEADEHGDLYTLRMAFNPPPKTHWLYTACTGRDFQEKFVRPPWIEKLYTPRPNENVDNLPAGYHERLSASLTDDEKQRLVEGRWGASFTGTPVYRQFKPKIHVFETLAFDPYAVLFRFWDFGYNRPACIWAQLDMFGRLLILRELLGDQMEATAFARLCKAKTAEWFPRARRFTDFGDPAVRQHKDTGKTLSRLADEGIRICYKIVGLDDSIRQVRKLHETLIEGEPAIQYSRFGCPITIASMQGGYRMKNDGSEPLKDGFYDHLPDALRYGVVNTGSEGGYTGEIPDSVASVGS